MLEGGFSDIFRGATSPNYCSEWFSFDFKYTTAAPYSTLMFTQLLRLLLGKLKNQKFSK
jgi:hypothetical protein